MSRLGDFKFEGLKDFKKSLDILGELIPKFFEECIKELSARLLAKTIARTPVDTGLLRRSWTIGQIVHIPAGIEVEIINPVEYAMYVEYGHRTRNHKGWVEGRFMLTISIDELEREMPAILDKKLEQFLKRHLRW